MKPVVSPRELASAIGVSESSLKRWSNEGLIQVTKTAGGHRRIAIGEAIRFVRNVGAPILRPELLGLSDLVPVSAMMSEKPASQQLFDHLVAGQGREARGIVLSEYLAGRTIAEIADGPIRLAMQEIGDLWRHDPAGIFIEHRATDLCVQAVAQLRQLVEPSHGGGVAVGGAPAGDPYVLPSLLCATALSADGWNAINLGADTPLSSLVLAAGRNQATIVWISISSESAAADLTSHLDPICAELAGMNAMLAVGGQALHAVNLPVHSGIRVCNSIADLAAIAGSKSKS